MKKEYLLIILFHLVIIVIAACIDIRLISVVVLKMIVTIKWVKIVQQETMEMVTKELNEGNAKIIEHIKNKNYNNKDRFSLN